MLLDGFSRPASAPTFAGRRAACLFHKLRAGGDAFLPFEQRFEDKLVAQVQ